MTFAKTSFARFLFATAIALIAAGCNNSRPTQLESNQFYSPPNDPQARIRSMQDNPGPLVSEDMRFDLLSPPVGHRPTEAQLPVAGPGSEPVSGISPIVRDSVRNPNAPALVPSTQPGHSAVMSDLRPVASASPSDQSTIAGSPTTRISTQGSYLELGAVVVNVNGTPIYANKVLAAVQGALAAQARNLDFSRFKLAAEEEVHRRVDTLVRSEIEFAIAQRSLGKEDKEIADRLTQQWRQEQITKAGGSIAVARQRALAEGSDFDELVRENYRVQMRRVYFQKKEFPKIQITANEMRAYYDSHKAQLFTDPDTIRFRVIKIASEPMGSVQLAKAKADETLAKIKSGADFATLAGAINDDPILLNNKGDVGLGQPLQRGSFAIDAVEQAAWKLQPNQVTPVIQSGDNFYIAQLIEKHIGASKSFDSDVVQAQIRQTLESEQFQRLRDERVAELMHEAIIYPDPPFYAPVVEMALEKYPEWSAAK